MTALVRGFYEGDIHRIRPRFEQAEDRDQLARLAPEVRFGLERLNSWTIVDDGLVLAIGGVLQVWTERGTVWSILSLDAGPYMTKITRFCRDIVAEAPFRRLECSVIHDDNAGHRWAELLGFTLEAPRMEAYSPDGRTMALYARIKR